MPAAARPGRLRCLGVRLFDEAGDRMHAAAPSAARGRPRYSHSRFPARSGCMPKVTMRPRRGRRTAAACSAVMQGRRVGDRRHPPPSSTARRPDRPRPPAGPRRRWRGRCCGPPAPARSARRRSRPRAIARRSGTGVPGCRPRSAARSPAPMARSAVSCINERSEISGQSCFGKALPRHRPEPRAGATGEDDGNDALIGQVEGPRDDGPV